MATGVRGQVNTVNREHDAPDHDRAFRLANQVLRNAVRQGGVWTGLLVLSAVVLAAAETLLPAALGRTVDAVLAERDAGGWLARLGLLVAVLVAADALDDVAAGTSAARSTAELRHTVVSHVLALGIRRLKQVSAGDLGSRLVANAADIGRVGPQAVRVIANVGPALGGIVALALIDPWLCLTFLLGVPVLVVLLRIFYREVSDLTARYLHVQGLIASRLTDALAGARTIAAAGTVDVEARRVLAPLPALHRHGLGMWHAVTRVSVQDALLVPLLEVAVLAVAGFQLARGRLTPGELLAASQYVVLGAGLGGAATAVTQLSRARAAADRLAEVLAEPPMQYGTKRLPPGCGQLEFRGVTARAGGQRVLANVDLVVPGGALVAIVGRSGSGKSLFAALAGRLVDPHEGEVVLDGMPLRQLDPQALRRAVVYGFERPALIGDTLAEVIAFGGHSPSLPELEVAAAAARADTFIRRLPQGYETPLRKAPMSGGEVQRVGLARAFAHAGPVLILDDVAASLDTVTEHHISRVLTGALADRTRIVVAHRASTAALADVVIWLDHGGVRRIGTHHELWGDHTYRAVFEPETALHPAMLHGAMTGGEA